MTSRDVATGLMRYARDGHEVHVSVCGDGWLVTIGNFQSRPNMDLDIAFKSAESRFEEEVRRITQWNREQWNRE